MIFRRTIPFVLILTAVVLSGCGTRGSGSVPANVNNVYVPPVENKTLETGLETLLTDRVTQQLLADGRVDLVEKEQADVVVRGTLTDYKRIPLAYNDQDIVQQYKVRIEMKLVLRDPESGETLKQFTDIFRETRYSDVNPPIETELDARERVVRKLARDVVTTVVEGWPYLKL